MKIYNKPLAEIIETQKTVDAFCNTVSVPIPVYEEPGYAQAGTIEDDFGEE